MKENLNPKDQPTGKVKRDSQRNQSGKPPKFSKSDMKDLIDSISPAEELNSEEAGDMVNTMLSLIRGPQETQQKKVACEKKHQEYITRTIFKICKIISPFILGVLTYLYSSVYLEIVKQRDEIVQKTKDSRELLLETRKILSIIGSKEGWEINQDKIGYKTPYEVKVGKGPNK